MFAGLLKSLFVLILFLPFAPLFRFCSNTRHVNALCRVSERLRPQRPASFGFLLACTLAGTLAKTLACSIAFPISRLTARVFAVRRRVSSTEVPLFLGCAFGPDDRSTLFRHSPMFQVI